jgi:hypothetical protein
MVVVCVIVNSVWQRFWALPAAPCMCQAAAMWGVVVRLSWWFCWNL